MDLIFDPLKIKQSRVSEKILVPVENTSVVTNR